MHDAYGGSDRCLEQENVTVKQIAHTSSGGEVRPSPDSAPAAQKEKNEQLDGWKHDVGHGMGRCVLYAAIGLGRGRTCEMSFLRQAAIEIEDETHVLLYFKDAFAVFR